MPLAPCPDCGTEVSDQAAACPKCGRRTTVPADPELVQRMVFIIVGVLVFIIVGVLLVGGLLVWVVTAG